MGEVASCNLLKGNARLLGRGEHVVVLSHGFGGSQDSWEQLLPHLLPRYRVLVYDLHGHGKVNSRDAEGHGDAEPLVVLDTEHNWLLQRFAKDLLEILDELHIERCTFVGHSVSGMLGCLVSLARPKLFTRMILIGASSRYLNDAGGYVGGFEQSDVQQLLLAIEHDREAWVRAFAPFALGPNAPERVLEQYMRSLLDMDPKMILAVAKAIFYSDCRSILPRVKVPCHLLQTKADFAVPYEAAEYLHRQLGSVEKTLEILNTEGHCPHLSSPELLVPALMEK